MKVYVIFLSVLGLCSAFSGASNELQCQAPNGKGIQAAFTEFGQLVPLEKVLSIALTAVTIDTEVQNIVMYTQMDKFQKFAKNIQTSPEFISLVQFACDKLHFDLIYYVNIAGAFLGLPRPERLRSQENVLQSHFGLRNMLQEIFDVIPFGKAKELFKKQLETDEYLRLAVKELNSEEYQQILTSLRNRSDFQEILEDIIRFGVDIHAIVEDIREIVKDFEPK